jgi:hypothetical protein
VYGRGFDEWRDAAIIAVLKASGIRLSVSLCHSVLRQPVPDNRCRRSARMSSATPLLAVIACAEDRLAGDEFAAVAIRPPEVLPRRSRLAQ